MALLRLLILPFFSATVDGILTIENPSWTYDGFAGVVTVVLPVTVEADGNDDLGIQFSIKESSAAFFDFSAFKDSFQADGASGAPTVKELSSTVNGKAALLFATCKAQATTASSITKVEVRCEGADSSEAKIGAAGGSYNLVIPGLKVKSYNFEANNNDVTVALDTDTGSSFNYADTNEVVVANPPKTAIITGFTLGSGTTDKTAFEAVATIATGKECKLNSGAKIHFKTPKFVAGTGDAKDVGCDIKVGTKEASNVLEVKQKTAPSGRKLTASKNTCKDVTDNNNKVVECEIGTDGIIIKTDKEALVIAKDGMVIDSAKCVADTLLTIESPCGAAQTIKLASTFFTESNSFLTTVFCAFAFLF